METKKRNSLTKQIICITIVLMLCNFIIPNVTFAANDGESGPIFAPISKFVTFLCDSFMQFLQDTFTTTESIVQDDNTYNFQYSPAIIFSGTVPAFDINFIKPNTDKRNENNYEAYIRAIEEQYYNEIMNTSNNPYLVSNENYFIYLEQAKKNDGYQEYSNSHIGFGSSSSTLCVFYERSEGEIKYFCIEYFQITTLSDNSKLYAYKKVENELTNEFKEQMNGTATYSSIAFQLQSTIATWYNVLRRIALVGLLSVLVYIGIQIILTSASGKENSKYKKMLIDWFIALCLLFTLHYIMSATLTIVKEISNVLNTGKTDELLNTLRNEIQQGQTWEEVVSQVIMYVIMVIYTVMFSFQYLKRVLYMGFFTMIAPLITLTYPLDKIKDSKAQAFTMWIREYIFNALIQVMHLVLYYALVGSALSLVEIYPLYGILAIGFMTQGEKIVRKMFGFDNATTVGTMQAAATGGLITAALNKLKKTPKPSDNTGNSNNIRTANNTASSNSGASIKGGAKSLVGKYGGSAIKGAGKAVLGTGLGAVGGLAGFAAGAAQGDIGKALSGALAGGAAGSGLGKSTIDAIPNTVGNIRNSLNNIEDTFNEGAYGAQKAKEIKEMRDFKGTSAYKTLKEKYKNNLTDDKLGAMLNAGISEQKDMDKILQSGNTSEAIGYYTLAKKCPADIYYDDKKLEMYLEDLGLNQTNAKIMRDNMKKFR